MDKLTKNLLICANFVFWTFLICLFLILSGHAMPFVHCFAVDGADRIYVGTDGDICVYTDGDLVHKIDPKTSRGYRFTINQNDEIVLSTASKAYIMDLSGNVLQSQEDPGAQLYNQIQYGKRTFVTAKGDEYRLASEFGWTRIMKNGAEVVYRISPLSFAVKVFLALAVGALITFIVWAARQKQK